MSSGAVYIGLGNQFATIIALVNHEVVRALHWLSG